DWYPTLLQERNGARYDSEQDVWWLEFQLRRVGIKGFRLYAKPEMSDPDEVIDAEIEAEDLPHIHSVRKALHWAGRLCCYLTCLRRGGPCLQAWGKRRLLRFVVHCSCV